jgi:general stress protein YciG
MPLINIKNQSHPVEGSGATFNAAKNYLNQFCRATVFGEKCMNTATDTQKKSTRGFASMDPDKQRAIARKGGESVPHEKRSFSQNPRLAAEAGRKGGQSVNPAKRSFSRNHALASEAGRKGGHASHGGPKKQHSAGS